MPGLLMLLEIKSKHQQETLVSIVVTFFLGMLQHLKNRHVIYY